LTTNEVLITGATGFIGKYILKKWLQETDANLHLLVRTRQERLAEQRVRHLLQRFGINTADKWLERIHCYQADVTLSRFGLSSDEYFELSERTTQIIHCAAAVRFDLELDEARHINVGGVQNIINFARNCTNLQRLDYIGTAYVSGWRTGLIKEDELDMGQSHRNNYERSKFEAELYLRQCIPDIPITVYRPSIVICDSNTGKSSPYNSFYRVIWMYLRGGVNAFPGYADSKLDLVPVDYVGDVVYAISQRQESIGSCYHLTAGPPKTTTMGEIRDYLNSLSHQEALSLIPHEEFEILDSQNGERSKEEKSKILKELSLYLPYTNCGQVYDNRYCIKVSGIESPGIFTYFNRFIKNIISSD
jgi:thioester reductase-like protein